MNNTILVTGFDPFGGESINPAWETVKGLPAQIGCFTLVKKELPTVFGKAAEEVLRAAEACRPALILMLGQAGGRDAVTPEQVAINMRRARIPDNAGNQPQDEPIAAEGPAAYFTKVPAFKLVKQLGAEGYTAKMSYSAGTFVCNDTFYGVSHALKDADIPVEFIHVPYLPQQAKGGAFSMEQAEMVRTVTRFLELAAEERMGELTMDIMEVIRERHSVRQYLERGIEEEKRAVLDEMAEKISAESGLTFRIVYDEPECFAAPMAHYGRFSGVSNYIVIAGKKGMDEAVGYYGEKLVLKCQELGLRTCWVALTHGKVKAELPKDEKVLIVISLGYGANDGVKRRTKSLEELCTADEKPEWFLRGMEAAMLAPTAVNQQKFRIEKKGDHITAKAGFGFYAKMDLGIVKCHFEMATGRKPE